jgi:hypothetical protein
MKLAFAAAAVAAVAIASPAFAGDAPKVNWYGNIGYTDFNFSDGDLGAVTARVGARSVHWGVEAEGSTGVGSTNISGIDFKLQDQYALYGVVFAPIDNGNGDLFARIGYGRTTLKASAGGFSASGG